MTTYANPGAIADVVADSQLIEATWGNAIRDRVVQNFATRAARDAAILAPIVGQVCAVNDQPTVNLAMLQYVGATDTWRQLWNMPWGEIGVGVGTSTASITTEVDVASATVTFTAIANRKIRLTGYFKWQSTVANDRATLKITDSANTSLEQTDDTVTVVSVHKPAMIVVDVTPSAGSQTYKLRALRSNGTGTLTCIAGCKMIVDDMGPAGVPA